MRDVKSGAVVRPRRNWLSETMEGEEVHLPEGIKGIVVKKEPNDASWYQCYLVAFPSHKALMLNEEEFDVHEEDQPEMLSPEKVDPFEIGFGDRIKDMNGNEFVVDTVQKTPDTGVLIFSGYSVESPTVRHTVGDMPRIARTAVRRMNPWV